MLIGSDKDPNSLGNNKQKNYVKKAAASRSWQFRHIPSKTHPNGVEKKKDEGEIIKNRNQAVVYDRYICTFHSSFSFYLIKSAKNWKTVKVNCVDFSS